MYIFIDESGSFAFPKNEKRAVACVGALTIPESSYAQIITQFAELEKSWGLSKGKTKGRSLSEREIAQTINILLPTDTKFHACLTDMSWHTPADVALHRKDQARRLTKHLTPQHHPSLAAELKQAAEILDGLSEQLYVQMCLMTQLVARLLRDTSVYYAFKRPVELGYYRWVLHAKSGKPTAYEEIWKKLIGGFLQTEAFSNPVSLIVEGGNYSHFERFCKRLDKWPEHLPICPSGKSKEGPIDVVDISKIMMESFTVTDAFSIPGLRLADICTNAFRRAVVGNLHLTGWSDLGKLMLYMDGNPITLVRITVDQDVPERGMDLPLGRAVAQVTAGAEFVLPT